MSYLVKKNNARTTINQPGGLNDSDATVIVTDASQLPSTFDYLITIWDSDNHDDPTDDSNREICKVTGVSGNTLTIERGQEDTVAKSHSNRNTVACLITAGHFTEIEDAIDNVSGGVSTLFVQQYGSDDLVPADEYFGQGGGFEVDSNGDLIPKTTVEYDFFFEYDDNDDLIPRTS